MLFLHLWHLSYCFNLCFLEGTGPCLILTEEICFLHGFPPVWGSCWTGCGPTRLGTDTARARPSIGKTALLLGMEFAVGVFRKNGSAPGKPFSGCRPPQGSSYCQGASWAGSPGELLPLAHRWVLQPLQVTEVFILSSRTCQQEEQWDPAADLGVRPPQPAGFRLLTAAC